MKVVKFQGRLGNQMFQYAFAKAVEYYTKEKVYFNSWMWGSPFETLFNVNIEKAPTKLLKKHFNISRLEKFQFVERHRKFFAPLLFNGYTYEDSHRFEPALLALDGDVYYSGYFQCEKYFKEIEDQIRKDFTFKPIKDEKILQLRKEIEGYECPIFINVRRGDYITYKLECCDMTYYQKATKLMAEKYPNCTFIAISDEPEWVQENLKIDYPFKVYTSGNMDIPYDIYLLQGCKHGICANSSFSWWGAWLIDNPDKTIIAPEPWWQFRCNSDTVPDDWIRLPRDVKSLEATNKIIGSSVS